MAQGLTARVVGIAGADPLFARIRQEAEEAIAARAGACAVSGRQRSQPRHARRGGVASRRLTARPSRSSRRADPPDLRGGDRARPLDRRGVPRRHHGGRRSRSGVPEDDRAAALFQRLPGAAGLSSVSLALEGGKARFRSELQSLVSAAFGVDINPAARIGKGVFLDHATSLVVGETTVIEDNVSILQGVTLGGTGKETGDRHPKIRHGVLIGAGAKILGNIEIGYCARVAAGLGGASAGAAQQDGRRRSCAHRRRSGLRRARARHEPDPRRQGARSLERTRAGRCGDSSRQKLARPSLLKNEDCRRFGVLQRRVSSCQASSRGSRAGEKPWTKARS